MVCQNCQAKLPAGRVRCPGCGCINPYNIQGYSSTKAVQTALKTMISEQYGIIADRRQFIAVMYDYLPGYDAQLQLLKKAVNTGLLEAFIGAENKKAAFNEQRKKLIKESGFSGSEAEFVLSCFGYMLGFPYMSVMFEDDEKPAQENKVSGAKAAPEIRPKVFGKFDALKYALSGRVAVKDSYTELAGYCFENYGLMKEITLPATLSAIGEYAFSDCKNLESITIPDGIRKMERGVFSACLGLKKVTLPEGLLVIGDNCFFCCTSLKALRVPDSVSSIGENAFSGCAALERLIVPKNVKFIDSNAFAYCSKLTVVCTENSFVHKYCMQNQIKYRILPVGIRLPDGDEVEDGLDE